MKKIAIIGTRGIPNYYGGFEKYAELLSVYLVNNGFDVTVYNSTSHPYEPDTYLGVKIRKISDNGNYYSAAGQFIYDLRCILDSRKQGYDLIYQLGYTTSAPFVKFFPKTSRLITNMDGMEWKRAKYGKWTRFYLKLAEKWVINNSDYIIADSIAIKKYLENKYSIQVTFSPYTAKIPMENELEIDLEKFPKDKYDLIISRMEPENNLEMIADAYINSKKLFPLMIIGSTSNVYGRFMIKKYRQYPIHFLGAQFDEGYLNQIRRNARFYFHGHSVGGTNPSLLEAMACECRILAHDNCFNQAVLENRALYFSSAKDLEEILNSSDDLLYQFKKFSHQNKEKIQTRYNEKAVFEPLKNNFLLW